MTQPIKPPSTLVYYLCPVCGKSAFYQPYKHRSLRTGDNCEVTELPSYVYVPSTPKRKRV